MQVLLNLFLDSFFLPWLVKAYFLCAVEKLNFLSKTEQQQISLAKAAVKKGRFADLQRQIYTLNKEQKAKPKTPVVLAELVLNIIDAFPVAHANEENNTPFTVLEFEKFKPEIIISESFIK